MSNIYNIFFDDNQPCPEKIPNCEQLRAEYKRAVSEKEATGCTQCDVTKIKVQFLEKIWAAYMERL